MATGKYFEDLKVGDKFHTLSRTVTETDIVNFVCLAGLHEELFLSLEYIEKESLFGKRIAPGWLTYVLAEGLTVQLGIMHGTAMALLGTEMQIRAPVFCGDTLRVEVEVTHKRETSKPDRGIVTTTHAVRNHRGETVMVYTASRMLRRRVDLE